MDSWGWRLMFALGVLTIPIGEYIRHKLEETAAKPDSTPNETPAAVERRLFRQHFKVILAGILLITGATAPHFIVNFYLANHAVMLINMPLSDAMWAASIAALVQMSLII